MIVISILGVAFVIAYIVALFTVLFSIVRAKISAKYARKIGFYTISDVRLATLIAFIPIYNIFMVCSILADGLKDFFSDNTVLHEENM